jgi:hypothetical protein
MTSTLRTAETSFVYFVILAKVRKFMLITVTNSRISLHH